ncbi:MAG: hypothetical protein CMM87_03435 [Rickettsiales bacterium]|nr:hypothetical protein [Rickettsiales bacterium]
MPRTLNKYLTSKIFLTTMSLSVVLIAAIWILQSLKFVELVLSTKASIKMFFKISFLTLPDLFSLIIPVSVFIATVVALNRMINDRTYSVMQSAGLSRFKICHPFIQFGLFVVLILYFINIGIAPVAQSKMRKLQNQLKSALPVVLIQEGVFNEIGKMVIYVREKNRNYLKGVFVSNTEQKNRQKSQVIITAQQGHLIVDSDEPKILLFNGMRQTRNTRTNKLSTLFFKETIIALQKEDSKSTTMPRPQEMPFLKLLFPDPKLSYQEKMKMRSEAHQKLTTPLLAIIFVLIGCCALTSGQFSRRGQLKKISTAVIAVLLVQAGTLFIINQNAKYPEAIIINYSVLALLILLLINGLTGILKSKVAFTPPQVN